MTTNKQSTLDLTHILLQILCIGILILASFLILRPFLPSLIWAALIVVATWPLMLKIEGLLWGKRALAVATVTIVMLLLFIVPFSLAIAVVIENADNITSWVKTLETKPLPPLPGWVTGVPIVGSKFAAAWQRAMTETASLSTRLSPYTGMLLKWFLSQAGSIGMIVLQFILTMIIAAILYAQGEKVAAGVIRFAQRLGGIHGEGVAVLAAKTIRGVAIGVVGTALIQALLASIGMAIAGVPAVAVLAALAFILCIAQLGPALVLIPAVIWLYYDGQTVWGTILLLWSIFVMTFDNILRPILITRGAELPLLLIFTGVIGGLITFGVAGLFIGPVVLAVTYSLLVAWTKGAESSEVRESVETN